MSSIKLPRDDKGGFFQSLCPLPTGITNIAIGAASSYTAFPSGTVVARLAATEDCWITLGQSGVAVSATSGTYLFSGAETLNVSTYTHLAVLRVSSSGTLNITRLV